ncbi:MAG TPA: LPS export ABC transporter permease LptF [Oleiagrimonas sp.]|nr:LPS export ABC transporter permease LptF [Oleiagrimonas sp.]
MTGYTDGFAAPGGTKSHYRMLRILDRYILRELATSVLGVAVVLLVVMAGGTFARVLQQVAEGSFPASVMFDVLGLKMLAALTGLLPLALFLGILWSLGRLYHDSEMHVLAASGMGRRGLLRPAAWLAIPMAVVIGLLSLWLGPWAEHTSTTLITKANHSVIAAGLDAGRFTELPGNGGTIFVTDMNRDGTRLGHVFLARQEPGSDGGPPSIRLITAERGALYPGTDGKGRYLALYDGWQYKLPLGADNWNVMQYARNDVAMAPVRPDNGNDRGKVGSATRTAALMASSSPQARAELAWRIAAPVTTLVLALLALPLARQTPREPRYGRLLVAVLCYFLYFSVLSLARSMIGQGKIDGAAPIWVLHLIVVGVSGWFLWRQYAPWKVKGAQA